MKKELKPYPIATLENVFKTPIDDIFGVVADTHQGSKYSAERELEQIYDYFDERGVKQVFHAGDLTDGTNVYRGQLNDLKFIGYEDQARHTIKTYPHKKNIKTEVIMGNHDAIYMKNQGADIIKYICDNRSDLHYAGIYYARFKDKEKNTKLDLVHPAGGIPYSISYGTQKYLRNMPPSYHPNILVQGHRHQSWYGYYQEVHSLEGGCFQEPTDFLIRMGCAGNIGGWLIDMERKDGQIKKFKPEWVGF